MGEDGIYRDIVDNHTDLICRFLPDTSLTFVNGKYCQYFGKTKEELLGTRFINLIPEEDHAKIFKNLASININNPIVTYEHRVIGRNRKIYWQHWTDRAIFNDDQEVIEFQSIGRDITEFRLLEKQYREESDKLESLIHKKNQELSLTIDKLKLEIMDKQHTQQLLEKQLHFVQVLIDAIPNPIFYKDTEGIYLGGNRSFESFMGINRKDLERKSVYDLSPKEMADKYFAMDKELFENPGSQVYESRVKHSDGSIRDVIFNKGTFNNLDGSLGGLIGVILDITERKKIELELVKSERKFRKFIETAPTAIFIFKMEKIIFVNNATELGIGYSKDELLNMQIWDLIHPEQREKLQKELMLREELDNLPFHSELRVVTKQGKIGWADCTIDNIEYDGKTAFIGVAQDVTVRKNMENKLKESYDKLTKALEQSVDALASAIELRDPYTAGHQKRVAEIAKAIALEMGLCKERVEGTYVAALLHDIGKIAIPIAILNKPTKLSNIEFDFIKTHVEVSYDVLKKIEFPWPVADIVMQHHERLDGTGYPKGLKGEEIVLEARIIAVADLVEAMSSHRPYRPAPGLERAIEEISNNQSGLFDSQVVDALLKILSENRFNF